MTRHFEIVILNPVGGYDCGLFALASACAICNGQDPSTIRFDQAMMRQHLIDGLSNKLLTPFPGKIKRSVKKLVPARTEVVKVYCTCRLPDDGHKMVECYQCKEWYHTSCVKIPRTYIDNRKKWNVDVCRCVIIVRPCPILYKFFYS